MGFLKNLLSSDFDGHFYIFGFHFMILSPDEINVLPMVEPRSFAVSAVLLIKIILITFFTNFTRQKLYSTSTALILKFLLYIRPPQYGTTSEVEDFRGQE